MTVLDRTRLTGRLSLSGALRRKATPVERNFWRVSVSTFLLRSLSTPPPCPSPSSRGGGNLSDRCEWSRRFAPLRDPLGEVMDVSGFRLGFHAPCLHPHPVPPPSRGREPYSILGGDLSDRCEWSRRFAPLRDPLGEVMDVSGFRLGFHAPCLHPHPVASRPGRKGHGRVGVSAPFPRSLPSPPPCTSPVKGEGTGRYA